MASYLQVENISKSYGDRTLFENISFNINEGDKIALVAPNGTGKSSLLKILAGVVPIDEGKRTPGDCVQFDPRDATVELGMKFVTTAINHLVDFVNDAYAKL